MANDLLQGHVKAVFREFLGRDAAPSDVAFWMATDSLRALVDGVMASDEYAERVATRTATEHSARTGPFLNCWIAGSEALHRPAGDLSPDGVAVVGSEGHLFLRGAGSRNLAAYRGETPLAPDWLERWRALIEFRTVEAHSRGCTVAHVVVPDKLAVYGDCFPGELEAAQRRAAMRLVHEAGLPLVYPADELRAARAHGDTYARTDTHLTWRGNRELARQALAALGVAAAPLDGLVPSHSPSLIGGDLGAHFAPALVELCAEFAPASRLELAFDNWPVVSFAGGYLGTRRVFRQPDAPDRRVAVLFGDGHAFAGVGQAGLAWFLAQVFRELHFVWAPFGWDGDYVQRVSAELVVSQTAERFIDRVPRDSVDVAALEEDTVRGTLGHDRLFADAPAPA